MKVTLIKDSHVGKKGEVKSFPDPMANYLIRVKIAKKGGRTSKEAAIPEKQAIVTDQTTKQAVIKDVLE